MATVKGVWVWNDVPAESTNYIEEMVDFTTGNGTKWFGFMIGQSSYYIIAYYMYGGTNYEGAYTYGQWNYESYRTIDFGETEKTVSDTFYSYLTANATQPPTLVEISITSKDGVRLATAGTYNELDINVTPDTTSQTNLTAENIKEGVSILGVTGTYLGQDGLSIYTTTSVLVSSGSSTIAQTAINIPEGRTLQVEDLIQDRFGVVGRVTAVGETVSYTFYADLKGYPGTNGSDGTDGKDGLAIYPTTSNLVKSGTGSIPVANIIMPEFRTIQIGDLLLDPTGVIGRATSGGTININYIFFEDIHGEDGTDGQDGAQGPAGRPALTCNGFNIDTSGEAPEVGQTYTMGMPALSHTPVIGEKFLTVINTATDIYPDGGNYLCGCTVTAVNGDQGTIGATFTFSIQTVNSITGQRGPAGQGVPTGGTTGQVLKKASNTNYDTEWADESGGGGGATVVDLGELTANTSEGVTAYTATISDEVAAKLYAGCVIKFSIGSAEFSGPISYIETTSTYTFKISGMMVFYPFDVTGVIQVGATEKTILAFENTYENIVYSNTNDNTDFSHVPNLVTTTSDSPDASSLPEGTLVIKVAS